MGIAANTNPLATSPTGRSAEIPLPSILRQAFADKMTWNGHGERVPLHSNIAEEEAEQLYEVVRAVRPEHSLEVGFAQGISTLAILQALAHNEAGQHHVMDPFQDRFQNAGRALVERGGLTSFLDFHQVHAEEVIPGLPTVQFAFIDSSHLFDLTLLEFVLADKKLAPGGVLGFHDLWMPSIQAAVRYILTNRRYQCLELPGRPNTPKRRRRRDYVAKMLKHLPHAGKVFRAEILEPDAFSGTNMLFLRKLQQDDREWQFHQRF